MNRLTKIASLSALFVLALNIGRANDDIFSITPFDQKKHLYATIDNEFDSSLVRFQIGEFNLKRSGILTPIVYNRNGFSRSFQRGNANSGIDAVLSNKFKTATFVPASGDSLGFYREAMMKTLHCKQAAESTDPSAPEGIGPYPNTWKTVIGGVQDTNIVVIKLEDVSDTTISHTIDSVAIYPNPTSKFVTHGGTNVDGFVHMRVIPSTMWSRTVRIRIEVTRRGPTPLGMAAQYSPENIAFSAYKSRSTGIIWSDSQVDSIVARYRELAEEYIRDVSSTANHWTAFQHMVIPDTMFRRIMEDYFTLDDDSAWTRYTPINEFLDTAGLYLLEDEDTKVNYAYRPSSSPKSSFYSTHAPKNLRAKQLEILGAWVNASHSSLLVKANIAQDLKVVHWRVVDINGRILGEGFVWPTFKKQGILDIPYRWNASGPIFLQLLDERTHQLSSIGVISNR